MLPKNVSPKPCFAAINANQRQRPLSRSAELELQSAIQRQSTTNNVNQRQINVNRPPINVNQLQSTSNQRQSTSININQRQTTSINVKSTSINV